MKKIKQIFLTVFHYHSIKYVVVLVAGVVLIGFVGSSSVLAHFGYKQRISELQDEIEYYETEYRKDQMQIKQLRTNPKAMERIARERYFMKNADEDIFVLSDDERQPQVTDPANETVE